MQQEEEGENMPQQQGEYLVQSQSIKMYSFNNRTAFVL